MLVNTYIYNVVRTILSKEIIYNKLFSNAIHPIPIAYPAY